MIEHANRVACALVAILRRAAYGGDVVSGDQLAQSGADVGFADSSSLLPSRRRPREARPRSTGSSKRSIEATVAAQTAGRVLELPYDIGDYVETRFAVIVRLRDTEQRARADSATRSDEQMLAHGWQRRSLAHERIKDVFEKGMVAKAAYDKALAGSSNRLRPAWTRPHPPHNEAREGPGVHDHPCARTAASSSRVTSKWVRLRPSASRS